MSHGYERLVLPVADSTFAGGSGTGLPSHTGRELGFISPAANLVDFRVGFSGRSGLGIVTETMFGGWASSDATGTDPFAQQGRGSLFVIAFGRGLVGRLPLGGGGLHLPAVTTGPQG